MTDDSWRRGRHDDDDFGPPLFADDPTGGRGDDRDDAIEGEDPDDAALSFGPSDTGPLPHWTDPPTGELPRVLADSSDRDPTDDLDVWGSFSNQGPVWRDDRDRADDSTGFEDLSGGLRTGALDESPAPEDPFFEMHTAEHEAVAPPRREPGRITIGTDPTDEGVGRPTPSRGRSGRDDGRGGSRGGRPAGPARTAAGRRPAGGTAGRDMPAAVFVGLVLAAAFVVATLIAPVAVLVIIVAVVGLAAVEFFDKVTEKGYRPATVVGIVACVAAPLASYWVLDRALPLVMAFAFIAGCVTFIGATNVQAGPVPNMAITTLGVTWIGLLGAYAALIVGWQAWVGDAAGSIGTDTLFLLALGVVANDIGALFVGSAAGKTPLRDWISPNKTVEGLIGGTLATFLVLGFVGVLDRSDTWNSLGDLLVLALVIAITAPLGDLTESMFKRNLDVKDFGSIIRGHGGVLDRFDGFFFALPATYYLMLVLEPWAS